jgi:ABC-2 type transport system ATP-binding protein
MSKILELKNVTKTLGKRKVVDHVSFDVHTGEIFGFLGPNGAGKTTTIKMIMGLLSVDEGEIFINGISLKKDFEGAMAAVGGIIENPELYVYMTGRQNLKLFGRMSDNIPQARYEEIIAQVKLLNRIDEKVKKYLWACASVSAWRRRFCTIRSFWYGRATNGLDPPAYGNCATH